MAKEYLDKDGLLYFWQKIKNTFAKTTDIPTKTSDLTNDSNFAVDASYVHTDNNYTTTEKNKLAGIASGAEVNVQSDWNQTSTSADDYIKNKPTIPTLKNVFGKVKVGSTTIEADTTQDTLELEAGSNVTLTPDATNDKVTIEATDTTYSDFTGTTHGLVPATSASGAFLCSDATWRRFRFYNVEGGSIIGGQSVTNSGYIDTTFYSATDSLSGLMSSTDKAKVDKLVFNGNEIDSSILPSYVDDVIEAYPRTGQTELSSTWLSTSSGGSALTPETGKIYVLMADSTSYAANTQFRWSGSAYVKLADGGVSEITNAEIDTIVAS